MASTKLPDHSPPSPRLPAAKRARISCPSQTGMFGLIDEALMGASGTDILSRLRKPSQPWSMLGHCGATGAVVGPKTRGGWAIKVYLSRSVPWQDELEVLERLASHTTANRIVPVYAVGLLPKSDLTACLMARAQCNLDDWLTDPVLLDGWNITRSWVAARLVVSVAYLRSLHIVHGDLKPANVLLRRHGQGLCLELCDFSSSWCEDTQGALLDDGGTANPYTGTTVNYAAPELWLSHPTKAHLDPTARSDVWSMATLVFHVIQGKPCWRIPHTSTMTRVPPCELSIMASPVTAALGWKLGDNELYRALPPRDATVAPNPPHLGADAPGFAKFLWARGVQRASDRMPDMPEMLLHFPEILGDWPEVLIS